MTAHNVCLSRTVLGSSQSESPREQFAAAEVGRVADIVLVQRCAQSDPTAMHEIVRRYQDKLYRFLHQIIGSHEDTEEVVLDVFLRVWQQASRFEGRASFSTWLYRIAANAAYDLLRQKKRHGSRSNFFLSLTEETINAEEIALKKLEREECSQQLHEALRTLRVDDRLLLILYYTEEMGYEEIREITQYSYPVLKMRLLRARRRLRTALDALAIEVTA